MSDGSTSQPPKTLVSSLPKINPLDLIHKEVQKLLGDGTKEVLQMELPARIIEENNYKYNGSDTMDAQRIKPMLVLEAEFRLANDMYDLTNFVGGPNGKKLSEKYEEVLFSMAPGPDFAEDLDERGVGSDQTEISNWLNGEVMNFDPPSPDVLAGIPSDLGLKLTKPLPPYKSQFPQQVTAAEQPEISRIDLYKKLLSHYEYEKNRWVKFKNESRPQSESSQNEMDAYVRLLSEYAPTIDAQIEAIWTLLIVRGQYHRVRKYIDCPDMQSAAGSLEMAKENLRASVLRNVDDTEDVYPVAFTPANWADHLSTNFTPQNLLDSVDMIRNNLSNAEKTRSELITLRNGLFSAEKNTSEWKAAEQKAWAAYNAARANMTKGFNDNLIRAFEFYCNVESLRAEAAPALDEFAGLLHSLNIPAISSLQFASLLSGKRVCDQRQQDLEHASQNYLRASVALAQANSIDGSSAAAQFESQIDCLGQEIERYKNMLCTAQNHCAASLKAEDGAGVPTRAPAFPAKAELPDDGAGASLWKKVAVSYDCARYSETGMSRANVAATNWDKDFLFWTKDGSSTTASGSGVAKHNASNTSFQIVFRAMKVAIDRPWMNAGLLAQSKDLLANSSTKDATWPPMDFTPSLDSNTETAYSSNGDESAPLPSFSTAFIVAKDVHIIYTSSEDFDSQWAKTHQTSGDGSSGFLLFTSPGGGSGSSSHASSSSVMSSGKSLSVRIPAPQIIGWICQPVD